jgi:hypothetical protein
MAIAINFIADSFITIIMHALHEVHKMQAYRGGHICSSACPSTCMFLLGKCWTDLHEVWNDHCTTYSHPNFMLFKFPTINIDNMADA